LERSLVVELNDTSSILDGGLVGKNESPSEIAAGRESNSLIADVLESLPEDCRQVIFLRHFEGLSFAEVAESMQRSVDSVEKLWIRALARLRRNVKESHA
jgi:RNA polymerase sigma-70 factor (ECF subfamily)